MRTKYTFLLLFAILILFGCNREKRVLAHRGSGSQLNIINGDTIYENTLKAIKYAFENFDGAEIDIQMSKSGTIWLYHNDELYTIDSLTPICIPSAKDSEIITLNSKLPIWKKLCTLEDILTYQSSLKDEKYISLDVKGYFKATCIDKRSVSNEYQHNIAKKIIALANKYNLENLILVETDYQEVLNYIKRNNNDIECYFLAYDNLIKKVDFAKEKDYDGISFNFNDSSLNNENIKYLHNNSLKIQIWTIHNKTDKQKTLNLDVDYIQSDILF